MATNKKRTNNSGLSDEEMEAFKRAKSGVASKPSNTSGLSDDEMAAFQRSRSSLYTKNDGDALYKKTQQQSKSIYDRMSKINPNNYVDFQTRTTLSDDINDYRKNLKLLQQYGYDTSKALKDSENLVSMSDSYTDYYIKFKNADEFTQFKDYQKDRDDKLSFDVEAGKAQSKETRDTLAFVSDRRTAYEGMVYGPEFKTEIHGVKRQRNADGTWESDEAFIQRLLDNDKEYAQAQATLDKYGIKSAEDAARQNVYVHEAEMLQTSTRLSKAALADPDFDKYANSAPVFSSEALATETDDFTDEEKRIYNYYLNKGDKKSADEYIKSIYGDVMKRKAQAAYEDLEGHKLKELAFGVAAGLSQAAYGARGAAQSILKTDDYIEPTSTQYVSQLVREDLGYQDEARKDKKTGWQVAYDLATTTANMAPSILVSAVVDRLLPGAGISILGETQSIGALVGAGMMGATAGGSAYAEMVNKGYDKNRAQAYAALNGASEAGLQYILGGVSKLGGKVSDQAVSRAAVNIASGLDNAIASIVVEHGAKLGGKMFSEGLEESIQEILDPLFKNMVFGTSETVDWSNVIYSGVLGALSAGALEGAGVVANARNDVQASRVVGKAMQTDGFTQKLKDLGSTFSADTVAYQIASKVDENTTSYDMLKLLEEVDGTLSVQNVNDIVEAMKAEGVTERDARTVAEYASNLMNGDVNVTKEMIEALNLNTPLQNALYNTIIDPNSTTYQKITGRNTTARELADTVAGIAEEQNAKRPINRLKNAITGRRNANQNAAPYTEEAQRGEMQGTEGEAARQGSQESNSMPEAENASQGKFEGDKSTSEPQQMKKVVGYETIKDDSGRSKQVAKVELADGTEALVTEANLSNTDSAYLTAASAFGTDAETTNAVISFAKANNISPENLIDLSSEYNLGYINAPDTALSSAGSKFSAGQKKFVRDLGKAARTRADEVKRGEAKARRGSKSGGIVDETKEGLDNIDQKEISKKSIRTAEAISKAIGGEVHVFKSRKEGGKFVLDQNIEALGKRGKEGSAAPNAWYDEKTGDIYIDINAGNRGEGTMLYALSHEYTHFIRDMSVDAFNKLADFAVREFYGRGAKVEQLIQNQINKAKANGREISYDEAYEEFVADSMETMLTSEDMAEHLQHLYETDQKLHQKLLNAVKKFYKAFKESYEAYKNLDYKNRTAESYEMLKLSKESYRQISKLYAECLKVAAGEYNGKFDRSKTDFTADLSTEEAKSVKYIDDVVSSNTSFSDRVEDKETLDFLENQDTVTTYKTMQIVDGKLYPPMGAVVKGSYEASSELGKWEQATEHPELIKVDKSGKAKFSLNKGKGQGTIQAAYNPYLHSSNLVLNDQFTSAYKRDNLVTVECAVPVSELTSGYHAEYAKDSVGWHDWHAGTVASNLPNNVKRQVLLSRWLKPVRIVPDAEVAEMYKQLLDGTDVSVPSNVVTPSLLSELEKAGVPIKYTTVTEATGTETVKFSDRLDDAKMASSEEESVSEALREPEHVLTSYDDSDQYFSDRSVVEGAGLTFEEQEDGSYKVYDKDGNLATSVTVEDIKDSPLGNLVAIAVKNKFISEKKAEKQYGFLTDIVNMCIRYDGLAPIWQTAGSMMFSSMKNNSDKQYGKTIDFSTVCKKTQQIVDVMSETMVELGRGLTRSEIEKVYLEVGNAGEETPCPVCYVFSRWMTIGGILDQISRFQDNYGSMSDEQLQAFADRVEKRLIEKANTPNKNGELKRSYFGKNGSISYGKVIADLKTSASSKATSALNKLAKNKTIEAQITELETLLSEQTGKEAASTEKKIEKLRSQIVEASDVERIVSQSNDEIEEYEAFQWATQVLISKKNGKWTKRSNPEIVPNEILFDLNRGADFAEQYPKSWGFRTGKGASAGKAILPYSDARVGEAVQGIAWKDVKSIRKSDYTDQNNIKDSNPFMNGDKKKQGSIVRSAINRLKAQNLIGGQRYQSTSDFRFDYGSDYLITFLEMQAVGAKVQLYTKVLEAVDFLAGVGADCNLSVMPLGDGFITKEDGTKKLVYSSVTGINADGAIEKSRQHDNVQLILVGISDEHIRLALAGDEVTFVIPFHGSGNNVHQIQTLMNLLNENLDVTTAKDYEEVQSDHIDPDRTAEQAKLWDLRKKILTGKGKKLESSDLDLIHNNEFLSDLYRRFYEDETAEEYGVSFKPDVAEQIFPYEYWDTSLTYDQADENGERFKRYCKSMGIIPRFSGYSAKLGRHVDYGDFSNDKGYWKLLIDRPMYDNAYDSDGNWIGYGKYHVQKAIDVTNFDIKSIDPDEATKIYGDLKINDPSKTKAIVREVMKQLDTESSYKEIKAKEKRESILGDSSSVLLSDRDAFYMQAVESGNEYEQRRLVDSAAKAAGYKLAVYHQTGSDFTVFSTDNPYAAANDSETPNGIFFKANDHDIGLEGQKQMACYIKMENPLHFKNREQANAWYKENIDGYRELSDMMDEEVGAIDQKIDAIIDKMFLDETSWEEYLSLEDQHDLLLEEMRKVENGYRGKLRELLNDYFLNGNKYDGIILDNDGRSRSRNPKLRGEIVNTYIIFDNKHVKSADPVTYDKNGRVIPLSQRFNDTNEDIRFSDRNPELVKRQNEVAAAISKENAKLSEENKYLKELVKLQGQITSGKKVTRPSLDKIAGHIMNEAGVRGDKAEFTKLLNDVYEYIAGGEDVSIETIRDKAQAAIDWLQENATRKAELSQEAQDVFKHMRNSRVYVDDATKAEIKSFYGDYNGFRKAMLGRMTFTSDHSAISLDSWWQEAAHMFPSVFDADTNPLDMPQELFNTVEALNTSTSEDYAFQGEMDRQAMFNLIYDGYWDAATLRTVADRYQRQINRLRAQHKNRIAEVRQMHEEKDRQLAKEYNKQKQQALYRQKARYEGEISSIKQSNKQKIYDLREQRDRKLREQKKRYMEMREKSAEDRKKTVIRNKIKKLHAEMTSKLLAPKVNKYIPAQFARSVSTFLDAINMNTVSEQRIAELRQQIENTNGKKTRQLLQAQLDRMLEKSGRLSEKLAVLKAEYDAIWNDPRYGNAYDEDISALIESLRQRAGETPIADMTLDQLTDTYTLMKAMNHYCMDSIRAKSIDEERTAAELSRKATQEVNDIDGNKAMFLSRWVFASNSPRTALKRLGGFAKNSVFQKVYESFNNAQLKMIRIQMEANNYYSDLFSRDNYKNLKSLSKYKANDLVDIGLKDEKGNPVKITRGMMLAVRMALNHEDNVKHIMSGGYTVPNVEAYYKGGDAYGNGTVDVRGIAPESARIGEQIRELDAVKKHAEETGDVETMTKTVQQLEELYEKLDETYAAGEQYISNLTKNIDDLLTDYEKDFIAATEQMFKYVQEELNATSMDMYGFEKFNVSYYFPIHTDAKFRDANFDSVKMDFSLENSGFTKERVQAANPILLEDITDVVNRHINNASRYAAFVRPLHDFNKIYGKSAPGYESSLQSAVARKFGNRSKDGFAPTGTEYIEHLIADINGSRSQPATIFDRARGFMAGATLTLNPRVTFVQAASFPSAAPVVGWKALSKATKYFVKPLPRGTMELINRYSPMMWDRTKGGGSSIELGNASDVNSLQSKANRNFNWLLGWISAMDAHTVGSLWYASQYYVDDNFNLEKGTDEYYMKVAEVFNETVERTQPMYSTMQRPDILRSPNSVIKMFTMFMTQRLQNFNLVYDSVATYNKYRKDLAAGKNGVTGEDLQNARSEMTRTLISQAIAAGMIAAIKLGADALLHSMNAYRDDDDELTDKSVWGQVINNFVESIVGMFLFGSEVYDAASSIFSKKPYYGIELSGLNQFFDVISNFIEVTQVDRSKDGWQQKMYKKCEKLADSMSIVLGIPVPNAKKIAKGLYYHIEDIVNGEFGSFEAGVDRTTTQEKHRLFKAIDANDQDGIEYMRSQLGDDFNKFAKEGVKNAVMNEEISEDKASSYVASYAGESTEKAQKLVRYWVFKRDVSGYDWDQSKVDHWYDDLNDEGFTMDEYDQYIEAVRGLKGKENIVDAIDSLQISAHKKDVLYFMNNYAASTLYDAPWH